MVTVYAWEAIKGKVGHCSCDISGKGYVSFWPAGSVKIWGNSASYKKSYSEDCKEEGNRSANRIVTIVGLNEQAMLDWWNDYLRNIKNNNYHILDNNCSTVVAKCLIYGYSKVKRDFEEKIGSGIRALWYGVIPDIISSELLTYTPWDVADLAERIKKAV